jgi:serine/threonine protein phosphatase PrpC
MERMTRISVRAFSDVGLRRKRNEDSVMVGGWVAQSHDGNLVTMDFEPAFPFVCAVADGMGGHAGGNVASRLALTVIAEKSAQWRTVEDVTSTVTYVNEQVRGVGVEPEFQGLGTTVAGVCLAHDEIIVFNVGDSRVYSITGGQLQQLSHDDAVLGVDGRPTNVITQSLGQKNPVQTHITTLPVLPGVYLMCSDGVHGMLTDAEIITAISTPDLTIIAETLIRGARANGAEDNFSLVIVAIPDLEVSDTGPVQANVAAVPTDPSTQQMQAPPPPPLPPAYAQQPPVPVGPTPSPVPAAPQPGRGRRFFGR